MHINNDSLHNMVICSKGFTRVMHKCFIMYLKQNILSTTLLYSGSVISGWDVEMQYRNLQMARFDFPVKGTSQSVQHTVLSFSTETGILRLTFRYVETKSVAWTFVVVSK